MVSLCRHPPFPYSVLLKDPEYAVLYNDTDYYYNDQRSKYSGNIEIDTAHEDVPSDTGTFACSTEDHLYADQASPGSGPADTQPGQDTCESSRKINPADKLHSPETYILAAFYVNIRNCFESIHYISGHWPYDRVDDNEYDSRFTDAKPANSQRKESNARQEVEDGYYQIVYCVKMSAYDGQAGKNESQPYTDRQTLDNKSHGIKRVIKKPVAGEAFDESLTYLCRRWEYLLIEDAHPVYTVPGSYKAQNENDLIPCVVFSIAFHFGSPKKCVRRMIF